MEDEDMEDEPHQSKEVAAWDLTALPAAALVAAVKLGYEVSKDHRHAFKPEDPLMVAVLDTRNSDRGHELILRIENLGAHGVYIEGVSVKDATYEKVRLLNHGAPADLADVYVNRRMGHDNDEDLCTEDDVLGSFIPPGDRAHMRALIAEFPKARIKAAPFGELELRYLVAGVKTGVLVKEIPFSLRQC